MQSVPGYWNVAWPDDVLERAIRSADGLAFVWDEGGKLAGFVCAHDVGFRGYLSQLVVAEDARGRGIGGQVVQRVETELTARGCVTLIADVWKEAEGFYRALGWRAPDVVLLGKRLLETEGRDTTKDNPDRAIDPAATGPG
jgi:ribosomal protein S18 acetylase RimI-like enzyme